jgi:hypothetical protein
VTVLSVKLVVVLVPTEEPVVPEVVERKIE